IALGLQGEAYTSQNSGATWSSNSVPNRRWHSVASSTDGSKLVAAERNYPATVFTSADSGATWTSNNITARDSASWFVVGSSGDGSKLAAVELFFGSIYVSTNSGTTWWAATNSPCTTNGAVAISTDGVKWVVVGDRGIYTSTDSGTTWTPSGTP